MIGQILAILIALSPMAPSPPKTLEGPYIQCISPSEYTLNVQYSNNVVIFETLKDTRKENVTEVIRQLTNALDAYPYDPDAYTILMLPNESVIMILPSFQGCVLRPIYMDFDFYKKIRGEKA